MRSFASLLVVIALGAIIAPVVRAETPSPRTIYTDALLRERVLRQELESSRSETPDAGVARAHAVARRDLRAHVPPVPDKRLHGQRALAGRAARGRCVLDLRGVRGQSHRARTVLRAELAIPEELAGQGVAVSRQAAARREVRSSRGQACRRPGGDGGRGRSSDERPHRRETRGTPGRAAHHPRTGTRGHVPLRSSRRSAAGLHRLRKYSSGRSHQGRHDPVLRRCGSKGSDRPADRNANAGRDGSGRRRAIQRLHAVQPVSRRHRLRTPAGGAFRRARDNHHAVGARCSADSGEARRDTCARGRASSDAGQFTSCRAR